MKRSLLVICLILSFLQAKESTTSYKWVYNQDKTCAIYDEVTNSEHNEMYWTGKCVNKKANGCGIAVFTDLFKGSDWSERRPFFHYEGCIKDGKYEGKAFVKWPEDGDSASVEIINGNFKPKSVGYIFKKRTEFIYQNVYGSNNSISKRNKFTEDSPEYEKVKNLVYKHQKDFSKSLKMCEYERLQLQVADYIKSRGIVSISIPSNNVLKKLKMLQWCQSENEQYKETIDTYKQYTSNLSKKEKEKYDKALAEFMGFAYYGVKEYSKSLDAFSKARYFLEEERVIKVLSSDAYKAFEKKRKPILDKTLFSYIESKLSLFYMSDNKRAEKILTWLKEQKSVDPRNKKGETPLIKLSYKNDLKPIKILIEAGADVNAQANDGSTALMNAAYNGHTDVVNLLIEKGANINLRTKKGNSAFDFAMQKHKNDVLSLFFKNGIDINKQDKNGDTPLHLATKNGNEEMVKILLNNGAKVNSKNHDGHTPLSYSIRKQDLRASSITVTISFRGMDGMTGGALSRDDLNEMLEDISGNYNIIKMLLDKGANPNSKYNNGLKMTILGEAISYNSNFSVIKDLVTYGADVNLKDTNDKSPLHIASRRLWGDTKDIVKYLLDSGANPNSVNAEGLKPIDIAARNVYDKHSDKTIKYLLDSGAKVSWKTISSAKLNSLAVIKLLLNENPLTLNSQENNDGYPLIHSLIQNNNPEVTKYILNRLRKENININIQNKNGQTPLNSATLLVRNPKVYKLLLNAGADKSIRNKEKDRPLDSILRKIKFKKKSIKEFKDMGRMKVVKKFKEELNTLEEIASLLR